MKPEEKRAYDHNLESFMHTSSKVIEIEFDLTKERRQVLKEGAYESTLTIAKTMKNQGISIDCIAQTTQLSQENIETL